MSNETTMFRADNTEGYTTTELTRLNAEYLRALRLELGHNGAECRVRIHDDGRIERHGSPEPTDRSHDYWHDMGRVTDREYSHIAERVLKSPPAGIEPGA